MSKLKKILFPLLLCSLCINASATITASYCEQQTEAWAIKHFTTEVKYGTLKTKARNVSIRRVITSAVIDGERYKTSGQAHVTYSGSTGGEVSEVRYFEAEIEDNSPTPIISFKEVTEKR